MATKSKCINYHDFLKKTNWIFDLDNTLYPPQRELFIQINRQMRSFIAEKLDINHGEAHYIQKDYFLRYGATIKGLMLHHKINPEHFYERVNDIDISTIENNPALAHAINELPGQKFILTNSSLNHALNTLDRIGITNCFSGIFDIKEAQYCPKPEYDNYISFIKKTDIIAEKSILFEDAIRNLKIPYSLGIKTTLVETIGNKHYNLIGLSDNKLPSYVDYTTDNLHNFLAKSIENALKAK